MTEKQMDGRMDNSNPRVALGLKMSPTPNPKICETPNII